MCRSGSALRCCIANADDRHKAAAPCRFRLGRNVRIGLTMQMPAFGMAQDDGGGACVLQHFGAHIPSHRPFNGGAAILAADGDTASRDSVGARDQGRGHANQHSAGVCCVTT
jgi:hypothetical protein